MSKPESPGAEQSAEQATSGKSLAAELAQIDQEIDDAKGSESPHTLEEARAQSRERDDAIRAARLESLHGLKSEGVAAITTDLDTAERQLAERQAAKASESAERDQAAA